MHANTNLVQRSKGLQRSGSSRAVPDGTLAVKLAKPTSNTYKRLNKQRYVHYGEEVFDIDLNMEHDVSMGINSTQVSPTSYDELIVSFFFFTFCNRTEVHAIHLLWATLYAFTRR